MSPIGRIFIVINFALALAFLGWASAALAQSQDYKVQFLGLQDEHEAVVTEKDRIIAQERSDRQSVASDLDQLRSTHQTTEASLTQSQNELEKARGDLNQLKSSYETMAQTLGEYDDRNKELTDSLERLKDQLIAANDAKNEAINARNELETVKNDLERGIDEKENAIAQLEEDLQAAKDSIQEQDTLITTAETVFGTKLATLMAQPHIDGAVLQVTSDLQPGLVSINRGSADNVRRGFTFEIYSGGQYKGRVRVVDVQDNMCTAVVEKVFEGRAIEQGDSATTHI